MKLLPDFLTNLFKPKTLVSTTATAAPRKRRRSPVRPEGTPRAKRTRQDWLTHELPKITGAGQYVVVPPRGMDLEVAQCRLTSRLYTMFGSGKYKTRQLVESHSIHVTIL